MWVGSSRRCVEKVNLRSKFRRDKTNIEKTIRINDVNLRSKFRKDKTNMEKTIRINDVNTEMSDIDIRKIKGQSTKYNKGGKVLN